MIARKTVLILGAGASAHLGFPSGPALAERIWRGASDGNGHLFLLLRECGFDPTLITGFSDALRRSGQPSVDLFLEHRAEFLEVGKTAIAAELMPFEIEDSLFAGGSNWYPYLFKHLGPSLDDIRQSRLSVVTFNYDRSLDQYLFRTLQHSFRLPIPEIVSRLVKIPIVHVHGQLGELPHWDAERSRPYQPPAPGRLAAAATSVKDSIKIVSEGVAQDREFNHARGLIEGAELVCFLGFGYLRDNITRLGFPQRLAGSLQGSAFDVREGEQEAAKTLFGAQPNSQVWLGAGNLDALGFLRQYPILR